MLLKCCCCCYQFIYGVPRKSWKSKFWNLCKCTWSLYLNEIAHLNLHLMNNVTIKFILSISISDRGSQSRDAVRNSRHLDWNSRFFIWHTRHFKNMWQSYSIEVVDSIGFSVQNLQALNKIKIKKMVVFWN